jgi:nitrogenase-associated protein
MTEIVFFEKPGCATNARQRRTLEAAGHQVVARNLLTEAWTAERLLGFFGDAPVKSWFNPAAPLVKDGTVDPTSIDASRALDLLLEHPLLIRRPLIEIEGKRCTGFDLQVLAAWIPLPQPDDAQDMERCSRPGAAPSCPDPDEGGRPR